MNTEWIVVQPPVYQRGDLYETQSVECGYTEIYRWINMDIATDWICDGTTKYYKQKEQVSYDEGQTWEDVIPYEYQRGDLYETQSTDCGYSPDIKFILTYSDGSTFTKYCNESSYILGSEVMEGGQKSEITEIFIGSCVRGIDTNAFNGVCKLKRVNSNVDGVMNIPEGVLELGENAFVWYCSSCHITSITLPSTMQRLSLDSFDSISCHQTLTINAVTPPYMFLDEYDYFPKPIYVPCQSVSAYKTAPGWSQFKDYIYGIPPCAQPIYRWTNMDILTDWVCDGTTKYYKQKKEVSFDEGQTWQDVIPYEYQRGDVYETESFDCGFIPYLTFEAIDDCTFNFYKLSMESHSSPLYSIDMGEWKGKWDSPEHDWVTVRAGQTIRWKWKPQFNSSDYDKHKIGYFLSTGRFNAKGYVSSMLYGEECLEKNGDSYNWWYVYTQLFKGNTGLTSAADVVLPTYTWNGYFISMFEGCTSLISAPVIPATGLRGDEYNAMFSGCTNLNAITYLSSRANSTHNYNWLYGVAPSGTFYKKSYLTNYEIGPSGIPEGWTIVDA